MALLGSLAVVLCQLLTRLQSTRIKRGIAHALQSSGHSEDAGMSAASYGDKLLACERVESEDRFIIQGKDRPFVEYDYAVQHFSFDRDADEPINCQTFTLPPKPSSALRHLDTHALSEDVIGVIASFNHDVHCNSCRLFSFNMKFLERCRAALTAQTYEVWDRVRREIKEEGGRDCIPSFIAEGENIALQTCMASPKANQVAVCGVESDGSNLLFIQDKEYEIKDHEDIIQARQGLIKKRIEEHQEFIKETQESIKKEQENIEDLQDVLDMRKQNIVYLKQIFEGPRLHAGA